MKNALLTVIFIILLILAGYFGYGQYKIFYADNITSAVEILKRFPDKTSYNNIKGYNSKKEPIKIAFKDFPENIPFEAAVFPDESGRLTILIDEKYKDDSGKILAPIIASRALNLDIEDSVNEEIYNFLYEAAVWKYVKSKYKIENTISPLVKRENTLVKIVDLSPSDAKYIKKIVQSTKMYEKLPKTSDGFSDEEFKVKFENLLKIYNKI